MARLSTEMHPLLTSEALEFLFAKNIYTVTEFIQTETKQLANIMRFTMKASGFVFHDLLFYYLFL